MISKCPICDGKGIVKAGYYDLEGIKDYSNCDPEKCRSCKGTGVISTTMESTNCDENLLLG